MEGLKVAFGRVFKPGDEQQWSRSGEGSRMDESEQESSDHICTPRANWPQLGPRELSPIWDANWPQLGPRKLSPILEEAIAANSGDRLWERRIGRACGEEAQLAARVHDEFDVRVDEKGMEKVELQKEVPGQEVIDDDGFPVANYTAPVANCGLTIPALSQPRTE